MRRRIYGHDALHTTHFAKRYARPDVVRLLLDPRPHSIVEELALGEAPKVAREATGVGNYQELAARIAEMEEELRRLKGE